jgi:hypothetical protein
MRKLFTKSSLCISAGSTVSGISNKPETFHVTLGKVWVTVEGSPDDHWLQTGESITVDAGRLVVIEADKIDSRVNLPFSHDSHRSFDFFAPLRALSNMTSHNVQQPEC